MGRRPPCSRATACPWTTLTRQGRDEAYRELAADEDATYDESTSIDLAALEPLVACPDSPDAVVPVAEVKGTPVDQVAVGSCTNSSFADLSEVASLLRGRTVHPRVTMVMSRDRARSCS